MTQQMPATGRNANLIEAIERANSERRAPNRLPLASIQSLAWTAAEIACNLLEERGNVLSTDHRYAIGLIQEELARLAAGELHGRRAYALPTGMGKTTAAAAFIAALYRLGHHDVAVTVAAAQVHALGKFREELLHLGVPAELIGIKHAVRGSDVPNTGDDSRRYQLVTHVRVRAGVDPLAAEYQGRERALVVYDETLFRADTASIRADAVRGAAGFLRDYKPGHPLSLFMAEATRLLAAQYDAAEHTPRGIALDLPYIEQQEVETWMSWIEHDPVVSKNAGLVEDLFALLQLMGDRAPLQVMNTGQGKGLISVRSTIPSALRSVAILDASTPIRELVKLDSTVHLVDLPAELKSFEDVQVFQRLTAGGRSSLESQYRPTQLGREIADIVQAELAADPDRCFLIFTFKDRGDNRHAEVIRTQLRRIGIDVDAVTAGDKRQFEFLTWGQQEGLNGYDHCETVILAGILTRDHISIAAAIKGQSGDPRYNPSEQQIQKVIASEIAHCAYQAASRGSCRVVRDGKASAMRLHLLFKDMTLRGLLEPVMPGATWDYPPPSHLPPSQQTGKTSAMLAKLLATLSAYPEDRVSITSRELKSRMDLDPHDRAKKEQFTRAIGQLHGPIHGWERKGRGVQRARRVG
ncbi:hypothetical protein [Pseudacidovorax intermedius]|uniref:hypothetical protein n=1 Tax=Pseudacidovorax intermedius TaxID=433924 RepID=UPI0026EC350D|nr:hypothetical protein [Pseudacidovorax intermedius]